MSKAHYEKFSKSDLILRDHLAIDRTRLANENTFLAYTRTALTILISGVSLIKFFDGFIIQLLGWILIAVGIFTVILGGFRYKKLRKSIAKIR
jgi:putative membrane protein